MGRLGTFLFGLIVGGSAVYGGLAYHVLRTDDGIKAVPKLSASFDHTYVDIRDFSASDWARHKTLVAAIVQANQEELLQGAAADAVREGLFGLMDGLRSLRDGS